MGPREAKKKVEQVSAINCGRAQREDAKKEREVEGISIRLFPVW